MQGGSRQRGDLLDGERSSGFGQHFNGVVNMNLKGGGGGERKHVSAGQLCCESQEKATQMELLLSTAPRGLRRQRTFCSRAGWRKREGLGRESSGSPEGSIFLKPRLASYFKITNTSELEKGKPPTQ